MNERVTGKILQSRKERGSAFILLLTFIKNRSLCFHGWCYEEQRNSGAISHVKSVIKGHYCIGKKL